MQIEKLIDAAIDYRVAELRAREQDIIGISGVGTKDERFHYYDEKSFAEIIKDKNYIVERFDSENYKYTATISGLTFFCLSEDLLFEGDEEKLKEDKDV